MTIELEILFGIEVGEVTSLIDWPTSSASIHIQILIDYNKVLFYRKHSLN